MATQVRDMKIFRPETIIHKLNLKYTDTTTSYKLNMGAGVYEVKLIVHTVSNLTVNPVGGSGGATIGLISPFLDSAQTLVADTAFRVYDANTAYGAGLATTVAIATDTAVNKYMGLTGQFGGQVTVGTGPWVIPCGLQITWTNSLVLGTGGEINVIVVASRVV